MAPRQPSDDPGPEPVVLHSSWRGIIAAYASMILLLGLAGLALTVNGVGVLSVVLTVIAVVVALIVLLDYPISTWFGPDGVERRCLLRHELLTWDRVEALTRTSDSHGVKAGEKSRLRISRRPAGLVAVVGNRRYLLLNHCESREECRLLRLGLDVWSEDTRWYAGLPEEDQSPTWLYRRRHHRPPTR